jgi:hypothetical protein
MSRRFSSGVVASTGPRSIRIEAQNNDGITEVCEVHWQNMKDIRKADLTMRLRDEEASIDITETDHHVAESNDTRPPRTLPPLPTQDTHQTQSPERRLGLKNTGIPRGPAALSRCDSRMVIFDLGSRNRVRSTTGTAGSQGEAVRVPRRLRPVHPVDAADDDGPLGAALQAPS